MPLSGALFASVTGLDATSTAISVVGDNIANVNTPGYKARRTEFADILGQNISTAGGFSQIGAGSRVAEIRAQFTQGTFESTGRETDLAIEGSGFFILESPEGRFYSRAGMFNFDSNGVLVNSDGQRVQGYGIDQVTGLSNGQLGDIAIVTGLAPPRASSNVELSLNLNSNAPLGTFSPTDGSGSDLTTQVTVFDSLGNGRTLNLFFSKTAENIGPPPTTDWQWNAALAPSDTTIAPATPGDEYVVQASGSLTFDDTGLLTAAPGTTFNLEFSGSAAPGQSVTLDFGALGGGGVGNATTGFGSDASTVNRIDQDGFSAGSIESLGIDDEGFLVGQFDNGATLTIAQLGLANFANVEGLQRTGNNNLIETRDAGQPLIGQPRSGSFGSVRSSSIEQSNVDLATEFVRLIINQRAYQANTRTISTTNELLGDLVNLGR